MEIGFIGLGNLGTVMVHNLIESGRMIHLFNRTREKMKPFADGARLHDSLESIAGACDIILSIVSDDNAVNNISAPLIKYMKKGSVHVCLSTISPSTSSELHQAHTARQLDYITATIIGRPEAAQARALTVCVSGNSEKKDTVIEMLKDLGGKNIYQFGEDPKTASVIKVCNNFLIIAAIEAMGEAFNLASRAGADKAAFHQMISETLFNSPIYKNYGRMIIEEGYEKAGFTAQLGLKDTRLALQLADEVSTPMPLADLIKNRFYINQNRQRNDHDWTSIAKVIQEENE